MFLKKYKFSIATFVLFFVFAFLLRNVQEKSLVYNLVLAFFNAITVFGIVGLISCIRKIAVIRIILVVFLSLIVTIDMTHLFGYGSVLSVGGVASSFETNSKTVSHVLSSLISIAIPILLVTITLIILSTRELKSVKKLALKCISSIVVSILIVCSLFYVMTKGHRGRFLEDLKASPILAVQIQIGFRLPLVVNNNLCVMSYFYEMHKFRSEIAKPKSLLDGISFSKDSIDIPNTVFVILGESSLPTHYSLYGYDLPTTPFLDSLSSVNKLNYYNTVAPAPITREALSLSLTFASPLDKEPLSANKNIVMMANDAGYTSYWLSNQNKVGMYDSYIGLIASYAGTSAFYNYQLDDLDLVHVVDSLYNPNEKQIFFIHMKGSHLSYHDKYDEIDVAKLKIPKGREDKGDYDLSIHHTDRLLGSLYNTFFAKDTTASRLLYYFSDHGEIVNVGHGFQNSNMDQFMIPFIVIPQNFALQPDSIVHKYMNKGLFNLTNFSHVFSESVGYKVSDSAVKKAQNEGLYFVHVDGKVEQFQQTK